MRFFTSVVSTKGAIMPPRKKQSTPGAKLINKGGAAAKPNNAAKKAKGGYNTKGTKRK
jgi:hypothetical protein